MSIPTVCPTFYQPEEILNNVRALLNNIPDKFSGAYFGERNEGIKWRIPDNYSRACGPFDNEQRKTEVAFRSLIGCISGAVRLWTTYVEGDFVGPDGRPIPYEDRYIFDPRALARVIKDDMGSVDTMIRSLQQVPRMHFGAYMLLKFDPSGWNHAYAFTRYVESHDADAAGNEDDGRGIDEEQPVNEVFSRKFEKHKNA